MIKIDWLFVKFILVGILNTLFGYSVFALLLFLVKNYVAAVVFSTMLGILFNFRTTGVIVFRNKNAGLFFKFLCVYSLTCLISIGLLRLADMGRINLYYAGFIVTGIMALLSFKLNRDWVFVGSKL